MELPEEQVLGATAHEPCDAVADLIDRFMDCMNQPWAVPFEEFPFDSVLKAVQNVTRAEAVSVFLLDRDRPIRLVCAAGAGYKDFYRDWTYSLDRQSLTRHVYTERSPVNCSADELDPSNQNARKDLPKSTFRCQSFLPTPFRNCVLVPLLFRHSAGHGASTDEDCLGVLKLENQQARIRAERFEDRDFASARVLGRFLAQILQQWQYRQLWASSARKTSDSRKEYFGRLADLVSKFLRAEASAIYSAAQLPDVSHMLTLESSIGYKPSHCKERFDTGRDGSVISDVARSEVMCKRLNSADLQGDADDKYVKTCRESICGSQLRNLLLIPVATETRLLGILSASNKIGKTDFGELDEQICRVFAKRIASDFESLANRHQPSSSAATGLAILEKHLGPSVRLKGMLLRRKASDVNRLRSRFRGELTGEACADYLQVSRAYFLKLTKPLTPQQNLTAGRPTKPVFSEVSLKIPGNLQPTGAISQ